MSRVKIINLKQGTCVINSLNIAIPGMASVVRDESVVGDPDLTELESAGIISIVPVSNIVEKPTVKATVPVKSNASKPKNNKKNKKIVNPISENKTALTNRGTDFRAVDGPEDTMGANVVIIGDNGPEVRQMNPGINGGDGPKYVGDTSYDQDDFITI